MITSDKSQFQTIMKMIDSLASTGQYDTLIQILSLLCLFSISNNNAPALPISSPQTTQSDNPLQKIIGELGKGNGMGSPDMLISLLPLLNNPQIKSKLNPANISSVMGMLSNLGGITTPPKAEPSKITKTDTTSSTSPIESVQNTASIEPKKTISAPNPITTAATDTTQREPAATEPIEAKLEKKPNNRLLNWKTTF